MINRRMVLASLLSAHVALVRAQRLVPVRLLLVRRPGLSPANQCVAKCIRGSIYDVSLIDGTLDKTLLPILKSTRPICDVIERPWKNNAPNISAVKTGQYKAAIREDRTKPWMTNENRIWRLELSGTDRRTAIQFHYGQDVGWSAGCFIVGTLLQFRDEKGLTDRYCTVVDGEAAIASLRSAVMAPGKDSKNVTIGVADDGGLFPDLSARPPC